MTIQKSKKNIMGLAALMIMMFHLWIPLFGYGTVPGQIERYLVAVGYVGVDLFFFVSAYTMTVNPVNNYGQFILNRAVKLLPLFIIALIAGQFLWFIPALMFTYLAFPPILRLTERYPRFSAVAAPVIWAALTALILSLIDKDQKTGIFLFRIPTVMLGAFAAKSDTNRRLRTGGTPDEAFGGVSGSDNSSAPSDFSGKSHGKAYGFDSAEVRLVLGILFTAAGTLISVKYGFTDKYDFPFKDTFYLTGIPLMTGLILLLDSVTDLFSGKSASYPRIPVNAFDKTFRIPVNAADKTVPVYSGRRRLAPLAFLGSISLELYFTQVVFGSWIVNTVLSLTNSRIFTNLVSFAFTVLVSYVISLIYRFSYRLYQRIL